MKIFFHFFCLAAIALGCGETQVTNVYSGGVAGKLVGTVYLWDTLRDSRNQYLVLDDHSGVRVEILGKPYSTISDKNGYWELNDIPPGNHTFSFTKEGFVPYISVGYPFVGNGIDHLANRVLIRLSHWSVALVLRPFGDYFDDSRNRDTIIIDSLGERVRVSKRDTIFDPKGKAIFTAKLLNDPGINPYYAHGIILFGKTNQLSIKDPTSYMHRSSILSFDLASGKLDFTVLKQDLIRSGFVSGEKVFCTVVAASTLSYHFDITTFKDIYNGFEGCSTEVKNFVLP